MIQGLHHIGIAVKSLDEALPHYTDGLGLQLDGVDEVPTERVRVAVLNRFTALGTPLTEVSG